MKTLLNRVEKGLTKKYYFDKLLTLYDTEKRNDS